MKKFRFNIGYEVDQAELVIVAHDEDEANRLLESRMVTLTPGEPTGGTVLSQWVNEVEEVE